MFFRTACVVAILLSFVLEFSSLQKFCLHLFAPVSTTESLAGEQSELQSDWESDAEEQRDAWLHDYHPQGIPSLTYPVSTRTARIDSETSPPFSSRDPPCS